MAFSFCKLKKAKTDGYTALKMTPLPQNWSKLPYPELIRKSTEIVGAVRESVGWDFDIGIEIHRNMIPGEAIVFAKNIEKFLPYFYEDPIAPDSVQSMANIADRITIPLAVGERNNTMWEFREYCKIFKTRYRTCGWFQPCKEICCYCRKLPSGYFASPFLRSYS